MLPHGLNGHADMGPVTPPAHPIDKYPASRVDLTSTAVSREDRIGNQGERPSTAPEKLSRSDSEPGHRIDLLRGVAEAFQDVPAVRPEGRP